MELFLYTDITYIPIAGHQWAYLASVFDSNTHRIIAYNLDAKMTVQLATKPVVKAHWAFPNASMMHSDTGSQYTIQLFESTLDSYGLVLSYSLKSHL